MTCDEAHQQMPALARDALPTEAAHTLRAHIDECPSCERRLEQKRQLALMAATVAADRDVPRTQELEEHESEAFRETRPQRIALAVAPAIVLAVGIVLALTRPWEGPADAPRVAAPPRETVQPAPEHKADDAPTLRLAPRPWNEPLRAEPPPSLRAMALESDAVALATVTDWSSSRVRVRRDEVFFGHADALAPITRGDPRNAMLRVPDDWDGVERVILFVRRDASGLPTLVAGPAGCVPVPPADGIGVDLLRTLVRGEEPSRDVLDALADDSGGSTTLALARLEPECELRGRVSPDVLARLAADARKRAEASTSEPRRLDHLRDLAFVLRISESPPLDVSTLRALHSAFMELPPLEPQNRIAHLRLIAIEDPEWAVERLLELLDVGMVYLRTAGTKGCPPEVELPLRMIGEIDPAAAVRAADDVLLASPTREVSRDVLDTLLDVAPDQVGPSIVGRARDEKWDDPEYVLSTYGDLVARVRSDEATAALRDLVPWLTQSGSTERRASFVDALRRAGPDGPLAPLLPEITASALASSRSDHVAFLLRCRLAVGGGIEPLREHVIDLLNATSEATMTLPLELIRAVEEAIGQRVLTWQLPSNDEIGAASRELVRLIRR